MFVIDSQTKLSIFGVVMFAIGWLVGTFVR